jgi:hypothetical protein
VAGTVTVAKAEQHPGWDYQRIPLSLPDRSTGQAAFRPAGEPRLRHREKALVGLLEQAWVSIPADDIRTFIDTQDSAGLLASIVEVLTARMPAIEQVLWEQFVESGVVAANEVRGEVVAAWRKVNKETDPLPSQVFTRFRFDRASPTATQYAKKHAAELVTSVTASTQEAIQNVVHRAFTESRLPSQTVGSLIAILEEATNTFPLQPQQLAFLQATSVNINGLTPRYANAVFNRSAKIADDLLDRGITGVKALEITKKKSQTYANKLRRARAKNIARTEIIKAQTQGRQAAFQQAASAGLVDPSKARVQWLTSPMDACPVCTPMNGQTVRLGEGFSIGEPPAHPSCRCTIRLIPNPDVHGQPRIVAGSGKTGDPFLWQHPPATGPRADFIAGPKVTTATVPMPQPQQNKWSSAERAILDNPQQKESLQHDWYGWRPDNLSDEFWEQYGPTGPGGPLADAMAIAKTDDDVYYLLEKTEDAFRLAKGDPLGVHLPESDELLEMLLVKQSDEIKALGADLIEARKYAAPGFYGDNMTSLKIFQNARQIATSPLPKRIPGMSDRLWAFLRGGTADDLENFIGSTADFAALNKARQAVYSDAALDIKAALIAEMGVEKPSILTDTFWFKAVHGIDDETAKVWSEWAAVNGTSADIDAAASADVLRWLAAADVKPPEISERMWLRFRRPDDPFKPSQTKLGISNDGFSKTDTGKMLLKPVDDSKMAKEGLFGAGTGDLDLANSKASALYNTYEQKPGIADAETWKHKYRKWGKVGFDGADPDGQILVRYVDKAEDLFAGDIDSSLHGFVGALSDESGHVLYLPVLTKAERVIGDRIFAQVIAEIPIESARRGVIADFAKKWGTLDITGAGDVTEIHQTLAELFNAMGADDWQTFVGAIKKPDQKMRRFLLWIDETMRFMGKHEDLAGSAYVDKIGPAFSELLERIKTKPAGVSLLTDGKFTGAVSTIDVTDLPFKHYSAGSDMGIGLSTLQASELMDRLDDEILERLIEDPALSRTIGGQNPKKVFTDPDTGKQYLFKGFDTADTSDPATWWHAQLDQTTAALQKRVGLQSPNVWLVEVDGKMGALQEFFGGEFRMTKNTFARHVDFDDMTDAQRLAMQKNMIFDYLISNYDTHHEQFISAAFKYVDEAKLPIGIDKGQAFKHLGKAGEADALADIHWNPNVNALVRDPYHLMKSRTISDSFDWQWLRQSRELRGFVDDIVETAISGDFDALMRPYAEAWVEYAKRNNIPSFDTAEELIDDVRFRWLTIGDKITDLEDALKAAGATVPDIEDVAELMLPAADFRPTSKGYANTVFGNRITGTPGPVDNLSSREIWAVGEYQTSANVSDRLRNAGSAATDWADLDMSTQDVVKLLDSAMAPIPEDIVIHRGLGDVFSYTGKVDVSDIKEGMVLTDFGYQSTSVGSTAVFGGAIQLHIQVPKGIKAVWSHGATGRYGSEVEMTLERGLRYFVRRVKKTGGILQVDVQVIPVGTDIAGQAPALRIVTPEGHILKEAA